MNLVRRLFRAMAVPTLLFLFPLIAIVSASSWVLFLRWPEVVNELLIRLFGLLVLEVVSAIVLYAILLPILRFSGREQIYLVVTALLSLAILEISWILALHPLKQAALGPTATPRAVKLAILAVELVVISYTGWQQVGAALERLNRRLEPILWVGPFLIGWLLLGGIQVRPFDRMPIDPPADPSTVEDPRPSIVLITLDAFAAQDSSLYGYRLPTTPNLERLARRSYDFRRFTSTSSFTTSAVSSMLTGMYPLSHRVFQLAGHLPHALNKENLPMVLRGHGYVTGAIVTNPYAHPLHLRIGNAFTFLPEPPTPIWFRPSISLLQLRHSILFSNAFLDEHFPYVLLYAFGGMIRGFDQSPVIDERAVFENAHEFIANAAAPFFLWIHIFPPHFPYMARPPFRGQFLKSDEFTSQTDFRAAPGPIWFQPSQQPTIDKLRLRYDEYLSQVDDQLGKFVDSLSQLPNASKVALIVTADHGENFRHYFSHASPNLRYPELHIPLLISLPGQSRGLVDSRDADLTDLAPTILEIAGINTPGWMEGHSLLPPARPSSSQPSFAMWLAQSSVFELKPATGSIAVTHDDYKLVRYFPSGRETLFDITHDPEELVDIVQPHPEIASAMRAQIRQRFGQYFQ